MKKIFILTLLIPTLSACSIVSTAAKATKAIVTVPVKVLTLTETEESDVDYVAMSESK